MEGGSRERGVMWARRILAQYKYMDTNSIGGVGVELIHAY
jgi:hypothetical protein